MCEANSGAWGADEPFAGSVSMTVLGVSNVTNSGGLNISGAQTRFLTEAERTAVCRAGDLLVVKSSGSATNIRSGKTGLCPRELDGKIAVSNFMIRLLVRRELADPYLLWLVLNSEDAKAHVRLIAGSTTYPNIKWSAFKDFTFSLPSLPEQRRIAGILKEQMAEVEKARRATEAQLAAARALPAAYLRQVFDSEEAKKWPRRKLGDVTSIVASQVDPRKQEYGDLPHVSAENIESGRCRLLYINSAAHDGMISGKYLFEPEDVLYSKLRPYLRKAMVADFRGVCSADMYPVRVDRNTLDPHFTAWTLVADEFTSYADSESRRARMPKLNRDQLFAWMMPVPSLARQREVAGFLAGEFGSTESTRQRIEAQLETINKLPVALLRKAFAGGV